MANLLSKTLQARGQEIAPSAQKKEAEVILQLKNDIKERLKEQLEQVSIFGEDTAALREQMRPRIKQLINELAPRTMNPQRLQDVIEEILQELYGLGKLQPYVEDDEITDILVIKGTDTYIVKRGIKHRVEGLFSDPEEVMQLIQRIAFDPAINRQINTRQPTLDARLPDGSRIHAIIPPASPDGPTVSIRKFPARVPTMKDLVNWGSLNEEAADFLRACVQARLNIMVSGRTGSGKTTLLNVLSEFIGNNDRIITIEDNLELQVYRYKEHVVRLETRPSRQDPITIADLVKQTLRMMPDRIIVGEIRDEAAADLLNAANTGHDGSMFTMHANSPREAVERLILLANMSGLDMPYQAWQRMVSSSLHLIVQTRILEDTSKRVVAISEIAGINDAGEVEVQDIWRFVQDGIDEKGRILGQLRPTGHLPRFKAIFAMNKVAYDWDRLAGKGRT